ncbi:MAG TPA: isocitrate/isopropylmalate dehydrogenase family protein [Candidatus Binataceae bacterium]|nr:isocitrate/isopropylmalate dehydrogenase family protein [Candidatus Binataceae bacterium]
MARTSARGGANGAHRGNLNGADGHGARKRVMGAPHVTLIPGDGVGPEVIGAAVKVIDAAGVKIEWDRQLAGAIALRRFGSPVPDQLIDSLKATRVALKGPLETRVGEGYRSINVYLRKLFDLYANVRPVRTQAGVHTPFKNVNLIVIRENTEDLYAGIEHQVAPGVVESVKIITARASTRIARFAFEYARANGRKQVTAIHKANIMKLSDGLFLKCAQRVAHEYRDIDYREQIVDAACMRLVTHPQSFDVLMLENLYGDIVSDLCAGLVGGLGFVPGANYGKHGAIFETVHGTAPDIAGKGIANPVAAIKTGALLLDYLGFGREGDRIRQAVGKVLRAGRVLTPDIGGKAKTADMTAAVIRALK